MTLLVYGETTLIVGILREGDLISVDSVLIETIAGRIERCDIERSCPSEYICRWSIVCRCRWNYCDRDSTISIFSAIRFTLPHMSYGDMGCLRIAAIRIGLTILTTEWRILLSTDHRLISQCREEIRVQK